MECPKCNRPTKKERLSGGGAAFWCPACGWGRDRVLQQQANVAGKPSGRRAAIAGKTWIKLPIFWLLSLLVVFGPYVAIVYGIPAWTESQGLTALELTPERMAEKITPAYWVLLAAYLLLASAFSPRADTENLGMFGSPMVDNPFSYEDDWNRMMLSFAFALMPGKLVWFTLTGTWRVLRHLVAGR